MNSSVKKFLPYFACGVIVYFLVSAYTYTVGTHYSGLFAFCAGLLGGKAATELKKRLNRH
jgi:hypothetical protein